MKTIIDQLEALLPVVAASSGGQWAPGHLSSDSCGCNCCFVFSEGYMGAVCTVHVGDGNNDGDNPPVEEAKANQRFIPMAHNLLTVETITQLLALLKGTQQ